MLPAPGKRSWLMGIAVLVFFWTLVYPRPYALVLLVNAALVALALALIVSRRRAYLEGGSVLPALFILPGIGLTVCVSANVQLLSRIWLLAMALAASVLLALILALADKAQRTLPRLIAMLILHAPLGYACGLYANTALDTSTPQTFHAVVRHKRRTSGRYRLDLLTLSPWGPRATEEADPVSPDIFYSVHEGEQVSVKLYPGRLGVPWFSIAP
jgi:hypothetical protein